MALDLDAVRARFPALALQHDGLPRVYFDNPAGTQVPTDVIDAMTACLTSANANIGGFFASSESAGEIVADARQAAADLVNASSADEIVFGQNMTSLTLHLARALGPTFAAGDEIVVTRMDHDANVQPWRLMARDHGLVIRWLDFDRDSFEFRIEDLDALLGPRSRLVCIAGASNLTGTLHDVAAIAARARAAGALTFVDAVQSAPHVLTDVAHWGCDFLACSAYKFFGPHQGILWGRRELLESLQPYKVRPAPDELPWRFEPGTQSHEGIAGTAAAIDYLASIAGNDGTESPSRTRRQRLAEAMAAIVGHERELSARLLSGLAALPGVTVQGISAPEALSRRIPTVSLSHRSVAPDDLARGLAACGVFTWSGHNYALEAATRLGLLDKGGVLRIGAVHYNSADEVDRLLNALEDLLHA